MASLRSRPSELVKNVAEQPMKIAIAGGAWTQKAQLVNFAPKLCQLESSWTQLWECGAASGIEAELERRSGP